VQGTHSRVVSAFRAKGSPRSYHSITINLDPTISRPPIPSLQPAFCTPASSDDPSNAHTPSSPSAACRPHTCYKQDLPRPLQGTCSQLHPFKLPTASRAVLTLPSRWQRSSSHTCSTLSNQCVQAQGSRSGPRSLRVYPLRCSLLHCTTSPHYLLKAADYLRVAHQAATSTPPGAMQQLRASSRGRPASKLWLARSFLCEALSQRGLQCNANAGQGHM
jgi:hypothetical protein